MDRVLLSCRAGCRTDEVLKALGMSYGDLYGRPGGISMGGQNYAPRNLALWSKVYPFFGAELSLSDAHREALRLRGLTDAHIHAHGYRSLDSGSVDEAIRQTVRDVGEDALLGTPGFVRGDDGKVTTVQVAGLMVPVTTLSGQIRAFKVRLDEQRTQGGKYVWFSGGPGGSVGAPAHVPLTAVRGLLDGAPMRIVEGPIKANVAVALSGVPTVGIPGSGLWKACLPIVQKCRPSEVLLAFDQDWKTNRGVRTARYDLSRELVKMGVRAVHYEDWPEEYKGIDDYLVTGGKVIVKKMGLDS